MHPMDSKFKSHYTTIKPCFSPLPCSQATIPTSIIFLSRAETIAFTSSQPPSPFHHRLIAITQTKLQIITMASHQTTTPCPKPSFCPCTITNHRLQHLILASPPQTVPTCNSFSFYLGSTSALPFITTVKSQIHHQSPKPISSSFSPQPSLHNLQTPKHHHRPPHHPRAHCPSLHFEPVLSLIPTKPPCSSRSHLHSTSRLTIPVAFFKSTCKEKTENQERRADRRRRT
jgi:hypothetical protein